MNKKTQRRFADSSVLKHLGFTLVEMLVVVAIIAILSAMLLPALNKAVESGRKVSCANNLRQVSIVLNAYTQDNYGWVPDAWSWWRDNVPSKWYGKPLFCDYGLGSYFETALFSSCPSVPDKKKVYYGINEVIGAGGFAKANWPPKPPSTRLNKVKTPSKTLSFIDGYLVKDSWVARPLLAPMGGTFATQRRYGWERHFEMPNMVHLDGHSSSRSYFDLDIYSWSDSSTAFWKIQ